MAAKSVWTVLAMNLPWRDVWYELRGLRAQARYLILGVLVVVCGAAISSSLVGVIDTVLWSPLPVSDPSRVRFVYRDYDGVLLGVRYDEATIIRDESNLFETSALRGPDRARVEVNGTTWEWSGDVVSSNYFQFLGYRPALGRLFTERDDVQGADPVVIISDAVWHSRFNADPGVIGTSVPLAPAARGVRSERGRAYTIVGVMSGAAERLASPWQSTQYWVPTLPRSVDYACDIDVLRFGQYYVLGRLNLSISERDARLSLQRIGMELVPAVEGVSRSPLVLRTSRAVRLPIGSALVDVERLATVTMILAGALLFISSANLSGMLVARMVSRRATNAVRLALGAGRALPVLQVGVDSAVFAVCSSFLAFAITSGLIRLCELFLPSYQNTGATSWSLPAPVSYRLLIVTISLSVLTCLIAAAAAVRAGRGMGHSLFAGHGYGSVGMSVTVRKWLVVPQIACAVAILLVAVVVGAGALTTGTANAGYNARGLLYLEFAVPWPSQCHRTATTAPEMLAQRRVLSGRLLQVARSLPSILSVSLASSTPFSPSTTWIVPRNGNIVDAAGLQVFQNSVSGDYLATTGTALVRGRWFDSRDGEHSVPVAAVSESVARRLWSSRDPIGQSVAFAPHGQARVPLVWREIVGVVGDVRSPLSGGDPDHWIYLPLTQGAAEAFVLARSNALVPNDIDKLSATLRSASETVVVLNSGTVGAAVSKRRQSRTIVVVVLMICAALSICLASLGIYSVTSYSVTRRIPEFGVMVALGATRGHIVRAVLRDGLTMFGIGAALGYVIGVAAIIMTSRMVVAMPPLRMSFLLCPLTCVLLSVLAASYAPARKAARVDPVTSLRHL